jgi:hypothetical protein
LKPGKVDAKLATFASRDGVYPALMIRPLVARMPLPMQRHDDPFLPWGKAIIDATRDLVAAYVFDFAAYLALGAAGAIALERTIPYAGDVITILHGVFIGTGYIEAAQAFGVDGVTLGLVADAEAYRAAGLRPFSHEGMLLAEIGGEAQSLLFGEDVLYASGGDDFAHKARAALQARMNRP